MKYSDYIILAKKEFPELRIKERIEMANLNAPELLKDVAIACFLKDDLFSFIAGVTKRELNFLNLHGYVQFNTQDIKY